MIPIIGITPPHLCIFPNPRPVFQKPYVMVFYMNNDLMREVVARFVESGVIVYNHCLDFLMKL